MSTPTRSKTTSPASASSAVATPGSSSQPGDGWCVAVLGATGLVGGEMLRLLDDREVAVRELRPLASARKADRTVSFRGAQVPVQAVSAEAFDGVDIVLASAGGDVSREWLPVAAERGAICIDNTSAYRLDDGVPLVVPEVNAHALDEVSIGGGGRIIANPNCSTIQLVVALEPLRRAFGIRAADVATYQSISGAGRRAVETFRDASSARLEHDTTPPAGVPAFDVLPMIGDVGDDGITSEERKMMLETPKILGADVPVDVTCVRVPVFVGHAEAVTVDLDSDASLDDVLTALREFPGIRLHPQGAPPTPAAAAGSHDVHIGRIRTSRTDPRRIHMWVVADNLLKGAAWNAVQIAEALMARAAAS